MISTKEKYYDSFRAKIEILINMFSLENGSDTPDYVLAEYLTDCLKAYDKAAQGAYRHKGLMDGMVNNEPR